MRKNSQRHPPHPHQLTPRHWLRPHRLSWGEAVELLNTIPGVSQRTAELLLAEIGTDMSRFSSAAHLASWAKIAPRNNESAGKCYSCATGQGNRWLRTGLVQTVWAAIQVNRSYLNQCQDEITVDILGFSKNPRMLPRTFDSGIGLVSAACRPARLQRRHCCRSPSHAK